ncbi:hypothetical protein AMQ84_25985 [Paenibacillus riograndensis]|uniref:Uncharacterized protein n=1 Tax=Paenibacillus riograndensis TaxID=483937 RepID=A0A132TL92_9BACL|nr:hypothetical protein [Paenibacillus riograndensis]KWX72138.1 hypothetical protein AMQ84_25985 [Paenibacillus riograndensis]
MNEINAHHCNLNIWAHLPDEVWDRVADIYESMPGWIGDIDGIPHWFGQEEDDVFIQASVEPSGLSFYAQMNQSDWDSWRDRFKSEATRVLGFEVGEPEDGFE